uniref:HD domain containing 3 n=1 Tax=Gasterosteus aculeatus TaxID=69293 RepID=G3PZH0_GASAC
MNDTQIKGKRSTCFCGSRTVDELISGPASSAERSRAAPGSPSWHCGPCCFMLWNPNKRRQRGCNQHKHTERQKTPAICCE